MPPYLGILGIKFMKYQLGQKVKVCNNTRPGVIVTDLMEKDGHKGHYVCFFNDFDDSWGITKIEKPIWWTLEEISAIKE
jgi:hypothetical protein